MDFRNSQHCQSSRTINALTTLVYLNNELPPPTQEKWEPLLAAPHTLSPDGQYVHEYRKMRKKSQTAGQYVCITLSLSCWCNFRWPNDYQGCQCHGRGPCDSCPQCFAVCSWPSRRVWLPVAQRAPPHSATIYITDLFHTTKKAYLISLN